MTSRHPYEDDTELADGGARKVSLAHELAAAMMPEQSLSSRMLAEEFGLDFEDGADEGMDGEEEQEIGQHGYGDEARGFSGIDDGFGGAYHDHTPSSKALEIRDDKSIRSRASSHSKGVADNDDLAVEDVDDPSSQAYSSYRGSPSASEPPDSLELLARNLQSTDVLIAQLRTVDTDSSSGAPTSIPPYINMESIAAAIIGRLNDMAREREQQARFLQDYEREIRRISAEVGGTEVLGCLDELENVEDLFDPKEDVKEPIQEFDPLRTPTTSRVRKFGHNLDNSPPQRKSQRRRMMQVDEEEDDDDIRHPQDVFGEVTSNGMHYGSDEHKTGAKGTDLPLHSPNDVATPKSSVKQMAYFRSLTQSLGVSLTTLSEHAQVNGVNTAEAGRKLRALKNKIVELKTDLDTAEKSRSRIEILEAGSLELPSDMSPEGVPDLSFSSSSSPATSYGPETPLMNGAARMVTRRVDGRQIVEEQLRGFRLALADAAVKTEAIMAR
ncbi:hypothetical protein FRB94_012631 [Tulasnella sp. JGI-2019a]|nr:hypothetical protein FRB93_001543 [Tulasnella sp. JGI-2019a]KAG9008994.1 hypothetical protein FRB94_012631 [Tulasnella sp. JGI-2019a]